MTHTPAHADSGSSGLLPALPFWLSLGLLPLAWLAATQGGWTIALLPASAWLLFSGLDAALGRETRNADPQTPDAALFWHRLVTLVWAPLQATMLVALLWYVPRAEHLDTFERVALFFGAGVITGTVGITYSHELMHQRARAERWLADILLAMVLYSHFRSEHLLVHHRHVGTPRDAVTARYGESFYRFFPRVLWQSFVSAVHAEAGMLDRRGRSPWHRTNPFWRYAALQGACLALALGLGGWTGVGLFAIQALTAIWQLELVNYVEHYGLARKRLASGRYEPVRPHHSWNADHRASNWLLINLQRHADHHVRPDRRFPLLQTFDPSVAPQLPYGYSVMTVAALLPPVWRALMHPRVQAWRRAHYPEIEDWPAHGMTL